ncbi:MAG TPA: hypothetical protein VIW68_12575 [Candidatus Sulfotelmatobacter sp.]
MSLRQPRIACHFPDGYTQHISKKDADELVATGAASWHNPTSIFYQSNNPEPSSSGARGSGKLACKVGAPLAQAFYRDRNRSGWATAFVERVRELSGAAYA